MGKFNASEVRYLNNVISGDDLNKILKRILTDANDILLDYCGPNSGHMAIFNTTHDARKMTKFTRDGINILRAIEYANPIDSYVMSMLQYIGAGLERRAGDGTTSAMLLSVNIINRLRELCIGKDDSVVIPYHKLQKEYVDFSAWMLKKLKQASIVPKDGETELIRGIAYHQALTSSHGDVELANIVSELLASLPRRAWSHMIYRQEAIETDTRYRLEINTATYSCTGNLMDGRMNNAPLGNSMIHENAKVIIPPHELHSNSHLTIELVAMLEALDANSEPTVCLLLRPSNDVASTLYQLYARKRDENVKLAIVWLPDGIASRCNDVNAIYSIKNIDIINQSFESLLILENVTVKFEHDQLKLYGFGEYDAEGILKGSLEEKNAACRYLKILNMNIENFEAQKTQIGNADKANRLRTMRNNIEFKCLGNIVIGGQIYEATAAKDVLEDVLSATREAISSGVLLGGFRSISVIINDIDVELAKETLLKNMLAVFLLAIFDLNSAMINKSEYQQLVERIHDNTSLDIVSGAIVPFNTEGLTQREAPVITQSFSAYSEFLKRFGDLCPKIVCMTRMIVPDAINDLEGKQT